MYRLCILLIMSASFTSEADTLTPSELYINAGQTVLQLEGRAADDSVRTRASAIALGDGLAATQCDVLDSAAKWRVTQAGRSYISYPHDRDAARNLCRLDVPGLHAPQPVLVAPDQLRVGQRVYAIGNALGLGLSLSEGLVAGIRSIGGEAWIQTTAALASGSEGGALFDETGQLVGVTDFGRRDGQNINFAAPATWLAEIHERDGLPGLHAQTRAEANRLAVAADWRGLVVLATDWTHRAPEHADAWLWLGSAREAVGEYAAAATAFDKAWTIMPNSLSAALGLARNQLQQQQTEAAATTLKRALNAHRAEAELWYLQGIVEIIRKKPDAADATLSEAVRLDSRHSRAWTQRFTLAYDRNDYRSAQQFASHLIEINPTQVYGWLRLSDAQLRLQRPLRALQAVTRAAEIDPNNVETAMFRGNALAALGRYADAIAAYRRALAGPLLKPELVWAALGNVYYKLGMFPDAITALREATRLAPDTLRYQADLGIALKDGNHDQEALALFVVMRDKTPQDPLPWRQIGFINSKFGQFEAASTALEQSLKLAPDQAKVWHALAEVYAMMGRTDDVRRIYQRLRGLDAGHAEGLYHDFLLPFEALPPDLESKL